MPASSSPIPDGQKRFEEKNIPAVGDDVKSQMGATIIHRALVKLFEDRGVQLERTYQINTGGNTDFLNMLNREPLEKTADLQNRGDSISAGSPFRT